MSHLARLIEKLRDLLNNRPSRTRKSGEGGDSTRHLSKSVLYHQHEIRQYGLKIPGLCHSLQELPDLDSRFTETVAPFLEFDPANPAFSKTLTGIRPDIVHAFTHHDLLTTHAKRHQLLYYRGQLVVINAKVSRLPMDTDKERVVINTLAGPIRPFLKDNQGYFCIETSSALHCFEDVNLHLRYLLNLQAYQTMLKDIEVSLQEEQNKDIVL
ncbi:MAG: hypothetical protein FJ338_03560 [Sphingomonadales bacterium]|nr:hypothetical protein [Sphingomonadales bacterium]